MDLQLCVLVQIDLDGRHVRLVVTGRLTETNQRGLHPVIGRARSLTSATEVLVDLTGAEHVEAAAVDLLSWEIDHGDFSAAGGPVAFVLPAPAQPSSPGAAVTTISRGRRRPGRAAA